MADEVGQDAPPSAGAPAERATPTYRVHGVSDAEDGVFLTLVRRVGKRESLVDVPLTAVELARLVEQGAGALRGLVNAVQAHRG